MPPERRRLLALMLKERGIAAAPKQTIPRRREAASFLPLALNQEGLWFIEQLDPGKANYNIPGTVRLQGRLHRAAMEQSLSEIVRRHEVLRTTFGVNEEGAPIQKIAAAAPLQLPLLDLQTLPPEPRENEARRLATAAAQRPFDLAAGPLFRAQLLQLGADDHALLFNMHHLVADGWSMGIFTREFSALYQAFCRGEASPLPELPIQYADFARWERDRMRGDKLEATLAYWRQQLAGSTLMLVLPTDYPRPRVQSFRGMHQPIRLPKTLTAAIRQLARQEGVTVFMVMLAAFKILLHRYSGQDDIVVGSTFANRNLRELENLIGFFVNTLPLRTKLSGDPDFREMLRRVREATFGAAAHQELPLAKLVQDLQPVRDPGRNPIYQVVFDLLTPDHNPAVYGYGLSSAVMERLQLADLSVTPMDIEGGIARFDIAVFIWDLPEGLSGTFEFSADLFTAATVARLVEQFQILLEVVVAAPDLKLSALVERLEAAEQQQQISQEKALKDFAGQKLKNMKRRPI